MVAKFQIGERKVHSVVWITIRRSAAWGIGLALFVGNWQYTIRYVG